MKRTVREILAECKGGREVMSLRDFTLCIKTIHAHLNLACFSPDGSRESKRHLKMADDICLAVEDCFADQNSNLVNWFRREPCEFHHPLAENDVKVEVRDDIEAIYYAQRTVQIIRPSSELSTEDQKIKAAAYCRVSTDSDDQENSFLAQVKYYSDYIGSREDMILVDIYADEGITGTAMSKVFFFSPSSHSNPLYYQFTDRRDKRLSYIYISKRSW